MFNVAIINIKNLFKNIIKIIIALLLSAMIFNLFIKENNSFKGDFKVAYIGIISRNLPISSKEKCSVDLNKILTNECEILGADFTKKEIEVPEIQAEEKTEEAIVENEVKNEPEINIANNMEIEKLPTEVIETNNKKDVFTHTYNSVKIKNESKYELTDEMLMPFVDFNNKQDILIFHTHTCESYTPTENNNYVATGTFRTTDLNYSVAHVGETLTAHLKEKGYNVTHNQTKHDYPAYTGSYNRSYSTVKKLLTGGWTELVIDLHRDALGSNSTYAPSVKIGDEKVAQLMFVIGTDGGGLEHPNWLNNFKLAIKIEEKANELYPGLFKPIILRNSRYNQNLASGACIIEVGATGNTLEECDASMKYLANVIAEIMK